MKKKKKTEQNKYAPARNNDNDNNVLTGRNLSLDNLFARTREYESRSSFHIIDGDVIRQLT